MPATIRTDRGYVAELGLRTQLMTQSAVIWTLARMGDPLAALLDSPGCDDPYSVFEKIRSQGPLMRSRLGIWACADYKLCDEILRDRRFGVRTSDGAFGDPTTELVDLELSLLEADPPDHTRLRKVAGPAFRPRKIEGYRARIEDIAHELLDRAGAQDEFDLIRDFATPLPVRVICELLGLPPLESRELARHGQVLAGALDGIRSGKQLRRMRASAAELDGLFATLIEQRREAPGDDVVSELVTTLEADGITSGELMQLCHLLLIAGFETTVNLMGNGVLALLRHPEQWELLREDPDLADAVVEETLRWDPPVHATMRMAQEPVRLGGHDLPTDSRIVTLIGAAGRDPDVHPDPTRFDITRPDRGEHLAFSNGIHYCLGAQLARMEAEICFRALATRLPKLRQAGEVTRRPTTILHGLSSLPVAPGVLAARTL